MSVTSALLTVALIWLGIGVLTSVVMGRRGHAPMGWWLLGTALGPLVLPLAVAAAVRRHDHHAELLLTGTPGAGPVDVLVGIDGSATATAALRTTVDLLGPRIGRLTLAAVVPWDGSPEQRAAIAEARERLESHAEIVTGSAGGDAEPRHRIKPELVVLSGQPAAELNALAARGGFDLLALGVRGAGLSRTLLGSVATTLAAGSTVPVILAGTPTASGDGRERVRARNRDHALAGQSTELWLG